MKEILKKDLLEQLEMGELAYTKKGTQDTSNKLAAFRPIFRDWNNTNIPDGWELKKIKTTEDPNTGKKNKELVPGSERIWVPLDGMELEAFKEANQEWLDSLVNQYGMEPELVAAKKTKDQPRSGKAGTTYVPSGASAPASTKIKTQLNRLVDEYLCNPEVSAKLEKLSIPEIKSRDRKHLNKYGRVDNEKIVYQTHTFNSYKDSGQFLRFVTARISGKPIEDSYKSYHLARQFSQIYQVWDETRKNQVNYMGKTDAYKLDKFGFDEDNLDVTVRMDLKIEGTKMNNQYLWVITFRTKFGRKLKEQRWIQDGLKLDKQYIVKKEVDIDPTKEFDDKFTVLDSIEIKSSLIEGLEQLSNEIMKWKPIETLNLAAVKQFDITKKKEVNESVNVAKQVISKINNMIKRKK